MEFILEVLATARLKNIDKKKSKGKTLTNKRFSLQSSLATPGQVPRSPGPCKALTPPPIAMELIRFSKRKVKVLANVVKSTPSKKMRQMVDS